MNVGGLTKQSCDIISDSSKGEKRKLVGQNKAHEIKILGNYIEKPKKAPLKAELLVQLKVLEKEHEALKLENIKHLATIEELENKVATLEEVVKKKSLESDTYPQTELDMSFGPRYCIKCGYEAEDGYQLDGHIWSEHEDTDVNSLHCQHCDQIFSSLKDLMTHKKMKHVENVSFCRHFLNDKCPFGDKTCWFRHETDKENSNESNMKSIKCNICGKILKDKNEYMTHRKENHEENLKICNLFKKGRCTYHERCWFAHRNLEIDEKINYEKRKEN